MNRSLRRSLWTCGCRLPGASGPCPMPPAPHVMSALYLEWRRSTLKEGSFGDFLESIGFTDPSVNTPGMDDSLGSMPTPGNGVELLAVPTQRVAGRVRIIVLLIEFPDRPRTYDAAHYQDLFFSKGVHPTGSLRDYYAEVSNGKVDVDGTVHGWLMMPRPYTDYLGVKSGMETTDYPHNSQQMAEDAIRAALAAGVPFDPELDLHQRKSVAGLVLVHAGMPAERQQSVPEQRKEIWSHKWTMRQSIPVGPNLAVTNYLTVAQSCQLGVCAHELGHLLFQWQDFYDPNADKDGFWRGSGDWDLMASGCYNQNSTVPAHPAGLHKFQHGWVDGRVISASTPGVSLDAANGAGGEVCIVRSPAFPDHQFLLLETRVRRGFDGYIPGQGLLVWRVDLSKEMFAPATPGMQLVQADGLQQLEFPVGNMQGDAGDPFPGSRGVADVDDTAVEPSTSFPGARSGVVLRNIRFDGIGAVTLDVVIEPPPATEAAARPTPQAAAPRRVEKAVPKLAGTVAKELARGQVAQLFEKAGSK